MFSKMQLCLVNYTLKVNFEVTLGKIVFGKTTFTKDLVINKKNKKTIKKK